MVYIILWMLFGLIGYPIAFGHAFSRKKEMKIKNITWNGEDVAFEEKRMVLAQIIFLALILGPLFTIGSIFLSGFACRGLRFK